MLKKKKTTLLLASYMIHVLHDLQERIILCYYYLLIVTFSLQIWSRSSMDDRCCLWNSSKGSEVLNILREKIQQHPGCD